MTESAEVKPKMGRPKVPDEYVEAAIEIMTSEGITAEEAAERIGISGNTVRRELRKRAAAAETGKQLAASDTGPVSPRAENSGEQLALIRRILKARAPDALAELEDGLVEATRGEALFARWLERPMPVDQEDLDPYQVTIDALNTAKRFVAQLPPNDRRAATILNSVSNLAKSAENIAAKRPQKPSPDEVITRITGARDEALKRVFRSILEAETRLAETKAELIDWGREHVPPASLAAFERLLGKLLGEDAP